MSDPVFVNLKCVPPLNVPEAPDNRLKVRPTDDGQPGISVLVEPWPFMAPSNTVTLHVCGQRQDGSPFMLRVVYAEPVTDTDVNEGWERSIPWHVLNDLQHGSSLVFVFQVAFDDCCGCCPLLFPPLVIEVLIPFEDLTTFTDGNWNHWEKGDAIKDARDLLLVNRNGNECLENMTYSSNSSGVVLIKTYDQLEVGLRYEFGLSVRRLNNSNPVPALSLQTSSGPVTDETPITDLSWHPLKGEFIADACTMQLWIYSHEADTNIRGNDYGLDDILVRQV
ncbi:hypothetical protein [Pseudomonas nunensis]|uniref:hypothetical protein n=1 Tax=Pseudomonas nunensis TaxID=2961896 RepID=UPI0006CE7458|nr:hypothetical protein AL066_04825 [Pseudomonas nunensis]